MSQIKLNAINIVIFLFVRFVIYVMGGYCDYSPRPTKKKPTSATAQHPFNSVRKIHPNVKISFLSWWSLPISFIIEIQYALTVHPPCDFDCRDLSYQTINIVQKKTENGTALSPSLMISDIVAVFE